MTDSGLLPPHQHAAAAGTNRAGPRFSRCQLAKTNGAAPDGIPPAAGAACESAVRAEAGRDAKARRNCCKSPAESIPRAANDRAPGIPDSGIAQSNRANIASIRLALNRVEPAAKKNSISRKRNAERKQLPRKTERIVRRVA